MRKVCSACIVWKPGFLVRCRTGLRDRRRLGIVVKQVSSCFCSSPPEEATEEEKLLSRKMMKYWANFARSG
jgi:hypothetical protein